MRVEKGVCEPRFLVEEDHGAEVRLLVGAGAVFGDGEFGEGVLVDEVVWAWVDGCC